MKSLSFFPLLAAATLHTSQLTTLYSTLDQTSIAQHFAFYELYPNTPEGHNALQHAWKLLSGGCVECDPEMSFPAMDAKPIISLVNRSTQTTAPLLEESQLLIIERLAAHLPNRNLKGANIWTVEELNALKPEEVDLARGLLVAEMGSDNKQKIREIEASLDLMALQILARLQPDSTALEKIRIINDYIFSELRFRFPPHSLYAKDIDLYTLLPSVIESRRGVCLGVSILYLSLAQRLDLPLHAITPPGHIYVSYRTANGEITNIETTARGIDVPSEAYLSLETRKLQERNTKEVIGLAFMNQAAVAWHRDDPKAAIELYEKSLQYLNKDPLIQTFLAYQYLFIGDKQKGEKLLKEASSIIPDHQVTPDNIAEDYLTGQASAEAIRTIFKEVDETRQSILQKQKDIEEILEKHPNFRAGIFHLAITHLQLGREKEAIPHLERYMELDSTNPTVCYYLAAIHLQRMNHNAAWKYLKTAESIVKSRDHQPKALKDLRQTLQRACPDPA